MTRLSRLMFVAIVVIGARTTTFGQQVVDPDFNTKIDRPAYTDRHPAVLFDEAHKNYHTADGRYKPFATLITNDGYAITPGQKPFSNETLKGYEILIIANAQGSDQFRSPAAADSAFDGAECDAVRQWVEAGGALLLIADIHPWGAAAAQLGSRLGVDMGKSTTLDPANSISGAAGKLGFSRAKGLLADHPILRGRDRSEGISRVISFAGQSLQGPAGSVALLKLADTANDEPAAGSGGRSGSAAGRAQGLALTLGKGRVVILGEAGMLTAQITGRNREPMGMNAPNCDNRQLALNIMHWLSALKDMGAGAPAATRAAVASNATPRATAPTAAPAPIPGTSVSQDSDPPATPGRQLTSAQIAAESEKSIALISGQDGSGTGFLVRPGLLMTNAHVIEGESMTNVRVRFPSAVADQQGPFPAELVYQDSLRDLALLRIKSTLPPLRIAPSYTFVKGDDILVIGNPGAGRKVILENAVSRGVMSTKTSMEGLPFYQLGIAVNPGNSGGPVFDSTGAVIGVVTRKSSAREALAFCIPVEDVHPAIAKAAVVPQDELAQVSARHDLLLVVREVGAAGALYCRVITGRNQTSRKLADGPLAKKFAERQAERQKATGRMPAYSFHSGVIEAFEAKVLPKLKTDVARVGKDSSVPKEVRDKLAQLVRNLEEFKGPMSQRPPADGEDDPLTPVKNKYRQILSEIYRALSAEPPQDIMRAL